ncbi:MAG: hypothetical protein WCF18_18095 [Chthoniobacteraceae bacterium]
MTPHQILTVATFLAFNHIAHAGIIESVLVPVTANFYGSGHRGAAATPQPAGGGGGTAPPSIDVLTTTQFGFLGSGSAKFSPILPTSTTPEGPAGPPTTFNGFNGLSGFSSDHDYALYGVFVGAIEPADPRPAALSFVGNTTFASLSPQLDQVFYIGDGLTGTGSGSTQLFNVPAGALKLYFGLADGVNSPIDNGFYGDNSGPGYLIEISRVIPEPSTAVFGAVGFAGMLFSRFRSRRND